MARKNSHRCGPLPKETTREPLGQGGSYLFQVVIFPGAMKQATKQVKECTEFEERAAIIEYDGKLSRWEAERLAAELHPEPCDELFPIAETRRH